MQNDNKEKKPSFKEKTENFWYYHKSVVITLLVIGLIITAFIVTKPKDIVPDLSISLVSAEPLTEGSINFNTALPGVISDINEDGQADIGVIRFYIGKDVTDESTQSQVKMLESQLADKGATLFIVDKLNFERMIKKDAFCPLDDFFDLTAYQDRVFYRNDVPVAFHLAGSKVLADMDLLNDDLYALLLFRRPGEENDPVRSAEYENAVLVLKELLTLKEAQ